jgi:hypothetical protein
MRFGETIATIIKRYDSFAETVPLAPVSVELLAEHRTNCEPPTAGEVVVHFHWTRHPAFLPRTDLMYLSGLVQPIPTNRNANIRRWNTKTI